jgi:hypothetical protein
MHSISSQEPSADKDTQWKRLEAMLALHEVQVDAPALSSATELMQAQSIEYKQESDRLKELLSLSGLDPATLDASLGPSLSTIAKTTAELGLAGPALSNLELSANVAWGQMAINDARSTNHLLEIRKRRAELRALLKRAEESSRVLDSGLDAARLTLQRSDQQLMQQVLPYYRDMPAKEIKYKELTRQFKVELKEVAMPLGLSGDGGEEIKKEVKHHALVAQHEDLEAAQARLREAQVKLEAFHGLPATQHGAEMLVVQARQNTESMQRLLHTALGLQQ